MTKRKKSSIKPLIKLLGVPCFTAILTVVLVLLLPALNSYGVNLLVVFFLALYPLSIYFGWLFSKVRYSDTLILDKVIIYGAPEQVSNQLKTTSKNRLVTVNIIELLGKVNKKPIQNDIVKYLISVKIDLTPTRIREILSDLERLGLIKSSKPTYERQYWLTKKGEWCLEAIKYYFPSRNGLFVFRNEIIQKQFPIFPQNDD
jgi:predicted transcriptional regulator